MKKTLAQRFWEKVDRTGGPDDCWEWQAQLDKQEYGRIKIARYPRLAHRVAYQLWHGVDPGEQCVLHLCDNPRCCNPHHLILGDRAENNRQRSERGRSVVGEKHWHNKLTPQQVLEIRASSLAYRELSALYGVSFTHIGDIIRRETWTHI